MMIGIFHSAQDSFTGQIRTLMLDVVVTLVPAQSNDSNNAPDWRVLLGDALSLDESILESCDAAYVDPARRTSGGPRRIDGGRSRATTDPAEWSPPWPWVLALSERMPVVAKVGDAVFERLSYSVLMNVGLGELVARSTQEYIEIALKLGADHARIAELRRGMRARLKASMSRPCTISY